ncbi:serine/threonine-protein kinase/endoribonuclease IRE1b-like [Forsythia ovata]|uniref:Serine/threonine-protein kinase/endoribonuclease IRE1b-like n=1 Tax=Forsythia ovata TaxID=205694 RepID=A0ABD1UYG0_9LAMI
MRGGGLLISFLFFTFLIIAVVLVAKSSTDNHDQDPNVLSDSEGPPANPPLPPTPKHDTAIAAAPDGMVYLVEIGSGQILWSFTSGPSIYSSYQALPNNEGEKLDSSADR